MNFKKIIKIQKIENLYEKAFSRIGMGRLMKLAWNNIKGDFNSEPNMLEFVKFIEQKFSKYIW